MSLQSLRGLQGKDDEGMCNTHYVSMVLVCFIQIGLMKMEDLGEV